MKATMKRRTFVLGAIATPVAGSLGQTPMAEAASVLPPVKAASPKPLTLWSIDDSNMAGFEWRWDFVLTRSVDGTYKATATQYDFFAEECEEPWELDPRTSLRSGREICSAVQAMVNDAGYYADEDFLERVALKLDEYDQAIAEEFRCEIAALAEELGWND